MYKGANLASSVGEGKDVQCCNNKEADRLAFPAIAALINLRHNQTYRALVTSIPSSNVSLLELLQSICLQQLET